MRSMWAGLGLGCVIVLTIGGGLIHGRLSNRWGKSADMLSAGAQLQRIPQQFGTWKVVSENQLEESAQEMLQCAGSVSRTYLDSATGASVNVTVLVGPPGPTSEHIPEICFGTQNFQVLGERKSIEIADSAGQTHAVWNVDFQSRDLEPRLVRTFYAWSTGGPWGAPESPRFKFSASPYLYKIQVVETAPPQATQQSPAAARRFLSVFLPAAASSLMPAP